MNPSPTLHRLPRLLEAGALRIKRAQRAAVERSVESLGLAALSATSTAQRDNLLTAQFELNRKSAVFLLQFEQAYDERVLKESQLAAASPAAAPALANAAGATPAWYASTSGPAAKPATTRWDALSLVGEDEMDLQVRADRFAMEVAHGCEWELRELDGYVGTLLERGHADPDRNPLRPQVIATALMRGVEAVTDRAEIRQLLVADLARSLSALLRGTYADIMAELRSAGVQPAGLAFKPHEGSARRGPDSTVSYADSSQGAENAGPGTTGFGATGGGPRRHGAGSPGSPGRPGGSSEGGARGVSFGEVDGHLMTLMRRLAHVEPVVDSGSPGPGGWSGSGHGGAPIPNVIRAHRDELRRASTGQLDHLVIDVIGSLFDQILADPKVPPQMARQIARLQLPVLRAAIGDPTFFSSRRHPVRRLVNRIASLGTAFEGFEDEAGQRFLGLVRELVQDIVQGDFEQVDLYEEKLAALERFSAEQAGREVQPAGDTARLLSSKEDELRLARRYARQLRDGLSDLGGPPFLASFLAEIWSQTVLASARKDGPEGERTRRLQKAASELFMSVQPKASSAQRKLFLAGLPKLMQDLNEGLNLIGWPEHERKEFFGQLLPAHAESLKGTTLTTLEYNLLGRRVSALFEARPPTVAELPDRAELPVLGDVIEPTSVPAFSADEARRINLLQEAQVDWNGQVDIDLSAEPEVAPAEMAIGGLPAPDPADAVEPVKGAELADHVQLGFAYRMHLEGEWHKVKLSFVSPGRNFFVFTRGARDLQSLSLTRRMLVRMCEGGRLRAFENAYLIERATARARRQLSALAKAH